MPICLTERPKNVNLVYKENMLRQSTRGQPAGVQLLCTAQKWVPMPVLMPIIARQQKKKLPRG